MIAEDITSLSLEEVFSKYRGEVDVIIGGPYNSDQEARKAVEIVADSIGTMEVCYMPDDDSVKARMNLEEQKYHHITGKKTKGHGGS